MTKRNTDGDWTIYVGIALVLLGMFLFSGCTAMRLAYEIPNPMAHVALNLELNVNSIWASNVIDMVMEEEEVEDEATDKGSNNISDRISGAPTERFDYMHH